jgi:hypothetical protein
VALDELQLPEKRFEALEIIAFGGMERLKKFATNGRHMTMQTLDTETDQHRFDTSHTLNPLLPMTLCKVPQTPSSPQSMSSRPTCRE